MLTWNMAKLAECVHDSVEGDLVDENEVARVFVKDIEDNMKASRANWMNRVERDRQQLG